MFRCCKAIFQVVTCSIAVTINLTNVSSDSFGPVEEVRTKIIAIYETLSELTLFLCEHSKQRTETSAYCCFLIR